MYEAFFNYLQGFNYLPLTADEVELIRKALTPYKIRRKQYLLQPGFHCKFYAFIVKGAMRQYFLDQKGGLHMVCLGIENRWIGDRESYVLYRPSNYYIEAVEDTEMLLIRRSDLPDLMKVPACAQMLRELDSRDIIACQRRLNAAISVTALERYKDFIACHPELIERFPQRDIASYLGINKDSLSRIKRQLYKYKPPPLSKELGNGCTPAFLAAHLTIDHVPAPTITNNSGNLPG
ncbi:Crp/Fnr family transcriptional regulator [Mucilaginibacter sp. UR6-1]|uniref:Crp/Fnr family transcriptional regulator n=1 Tax=Mucilaginibacter sp. UR6-1 TaxID=1435643 RepID=UPI001E503F6D|nr:Crp/Fnr family transcriptional regulator [Mucilaginibacter sp. UR6-1]MCC8407503.1 Crp/Fnr family transcriptional regulator [Mucilaginibacter sp. UR6-1]